MFRFIALTAVVVLACAMPAVACTFGETLVEEPLVLQAAPLSQVVYSQTVVRRAPVVFEAAPVDDTIVLQARPLRAVPVEQVALGGGFFAGRRQGRRAANFNAGFNEGFFGAPVNRGRVFFAPAPCGPGGCAPRGTVFFVR